MSRIDYTWIATTPVKPDVYMTRINESKVHTVRYWDGRRWFDISTSAAAVLAATLLRGLHLRQSIATLIPSKFGATMPQNHVSRVNQCHDYKYRTRQPTRGVQPRV